MASKAAKKAAGSRQGCSSTDLDRFAYCFIHASDRTDVSISFPARAVFEVP